MKAKKVERKVILSLFALAGLIGAFSLAIAGTLEPSAPPAPTMHSLDEIHSQLEAIAPANGDSLPTHEQIAGSAAIHMTVTGISQGPIAGSSEETGREGTSLILGFDHSITIPFDSPTGLPSGPRQHNPVMITKYIDKASPKLYQACTTGEILNPVELKFYRIGPTLAEEHYYTIELENARIVDVKQTGTNFEHISMTYQKITWSWLPDGGITHTDEWIFTP